MNNLLEKIIHKFMTIGRWRFVGLFVFLSIITTEIIVSQLSIMFHGRITHDYMITGAITAFIVSFIVVSIIVYLRKKAEEELRLHENRLNLLLDLHRMVDATEKEIMDFVIGACLISAQSRFAFIGRMSADESTMIIHAWSKGAMEQCLVTEKPIYFPVAEAGLWGEVVRQRRPIIVNDYETSSEFKKGYPEGHVPIKRFLGIPVFNRDRIVAVAAVANKEAEYTESDVRSLTTLLHEMWSLIEHRRIDEALRESEGRYRMVVEQATDGVFITDSEGRIVDVNTSGCQMHGYSREEMLRMGIADLVLPTEAVRIGPFFKALACGERVLDEWQARRKDGSAFVVETNASRLSGGRYLGIVRDVTERKKAENLISARMQLSQFALSHSLDELLQATLDEVEKLTNSQIGFYHFLEPDQRTLSLQMWSTRTLREMCKAEGRGIHYDLDKAGVWVDCVRERRPVIHNDYSALPHKKGMPPGHANVIRELVVPVFRGNTIVAILGVGNKPNDYDESDISTVSLFADLAWDIAERKKAEEAITQAKKDWEATFDSISDPLFIHDREFKIIRANKAYQDVSGMPLSDIIGKPYYKVFPKMEAPFSGCLKALKLQEEEEEEVSTPLTGRTYKIRFYPTRETGYSVHILEDITESKRLEAQLRQVQKMEAIGTLAGGIAHDFNNMLNAIMGYGGLIQMDMKEDDPHRAYLKEMLDAAERASHLTKGLLAFSRKQPMETKSVNINEIVIGFKKMIKRMIGEDIELNITLTDRDLTVMADSGQIEQVLMNLATNARDAMPEGGILSIETGLAEINKEYINTHGYGKEGMYAIIAIADTGIGMDEMTRQRIFEPFFTTKELGRGTGLGLAIIYGIVKQHNGYIDCYSELGKGTTFKIYLPLIKKEIEEEKIELPPVRGGTETILLAEDEDAVRRASMTVLERYGYNVIEAVDGGDAVNKFMENKDRIQLLMLDVIMPKKNGKEAYEEIRKIMPDIKTIFTSGYTADILEKKGILEEGINFVFKPIPPDGLLRKVREVLDR